MVLWNFRKKEYKRPPDLLLSIFLKLQYLEIKFCGTMLKKGEVVDL